MNNETYNQELFEVVVRCAANEYVDLKVERAQREAEEDPLPEISAGTERRMRRLFRKRRWEVRMAKVAKPVRRTAAVFACVVTLAGASIMSVSAWRENFFRIFFSPRVDYARMSQEDLRMEYSNAVPEGWSNVYIPVYVPEGYKLVGKESGQKRVSFVYQNDTGKTFKFIQTNEVIEEQFGLIDQEKTKDIPVEIGPYEGKLSKKNEQNHLMWNNGSYTFNILGPISGETLIKIAENTEIFM